MTAAADITYEEFIEHYPEFAESSSGIPPRSAVEYKLEQGNITLSRHEWGAYWHFAVELWTAHYIALRFNISPNFSAKGLQNLDSVVGVSQSMSAGSSNLSESRTMPAMLNSQNPFYADMARTEYGMEFLSLMQAVISPAGIVLSPDTSDSITNYGLKE